MMRQRKTRSIFYRLVLGIGLVASASSLLLLGAVVLDYHLSFQDLVTGESTSLAWFEVREHVVIPALLFVLPTALAVIVAIRLALAPLEQAAREINEVKGNQRSFRLAAGNLPDEVRPFVDAINALLSRLDAAAAQQEAFAADVAHELRTPLALMSLELEKLGGPAKDRLWEDVRSMQRLVDQLLLLAQIKMAKESQIPRAELSLADVARDCVAALAPLVIANGRIIEFEEGGKDIVVSGWREAITAAIRNLVENSLQASPPGGMIVVSVGPGPSIQVKDEGPGIASGQLELLVKRNVRGDHYSGKGAGLGLAIVNQIMAAHGGELQSDPATRTLALNFPISLAGIDQSHKR